MLTSALRIRGIPMEELGPEVEVAKQEWLFWPDYAVWLATERSSSAAKQAG
jgi:hypothetical protein